MPKTGGLLDGLFGINNASTYLLKLDESNNQTAVTISQFEDDRDFDQGMLMDGTVNYTYDNSAKLAGLIFKTLQNDVSH
ncbi:MAG: hypothetical protein FJ190_10730 [Gammaproteobacteria bacterium]|nr:hypothetical protein [Gammaproteobacteria bacterium]